MKLSDLIRKVYPTRKGPFRQIRTEIKSQDLRDSDELFPSTIELQLMDSEIAPDVNEFGKSDKDFLKHVSGFDRQVYNSPNELITIPDDMRSTTGEMSVYHHPDDTMESDPLRDSTEGSIYFHEQKPEQTSVSIDEANALKQFKIVYGLGIGALLFVALLFTTALLLKAERAFDQAYENETRNSAALSEFSDRVTLDYAVLLNRKWPLPDINAMRQENIQSTPDIFKDSDFYTTPSSIQKTDTKTISAIITKKPILISIFGKPLIPRNKDIRQSITSAREAVKYKYHVETSEYKESKQNPKLQMQSMKNTPKYFNPESESQGIIDEGLFMEESYRNLVQRMKLTKEEAREGMILLNTSIPQDLCSPISVKKCNVSYVYRSLDGSCNNLRNTMWGSTNEPFRRILFPDYDDGISVPRTYSINNSLLASAREISQKVHIDEYREDISASLMFPLWAHFVEHDLTFTATVESSESQHDSNRKNESCCNDGEKINASFSFNTKSKCFPITIHPDDPFYSSHNVSCMNFLRAEPYGNCRLGPREQFNKATAYLDASNIYGTTYDLMNSLRLNKSGALKTTDSDDGLNLLPILSDPEDPCNKKFQVRNRHFCFKGGDSRVNEVATITALHTVWVRQHNRISEFLAAHNPHWDDEKVFQETRRIVIAQIQFITFNEFLPELLTPELLEKADLKLKEEGYYQNYDNTVQPTISNAFTLAFRYRYSMIQGLLKMEGPNGKNQDYVQIHKFVSNPFLLWKYGAMDEMLRGASSQPAAKIDAFVSGQLTHHIYQQPNSSYGMDLVAITIQRGRDQGLPSYTQWRNACGLSNVSDFNDLRDIWEDGAFIRTLEAYKFVEDIDLYTGMLAEKPVEGGRIGPTLSCIIADQFVRLKKGDMFWFEGDIRENHFTPEQLTAIRATTLAKIICDNSDDIRELQSKLMHKPSPENPIVPCFILQKVNYGPWKEKVFNKASGKTSGKVNNKSDQNGKKEDGGLTEEVWNPDSLEDSLEHANFHKVKSKPQGIILNLSPTSIKRKVMNTSLTLINFNHTRNDSALVSNNVH